MIKNYLKIALRNFSKHKITSLISIVSLSIGITSCFLIFMWVQDELSFDTHHLNKDKIVKVDGDVSFNDKDITLGTQTNYTGPMLHKDLPEIENYVRVTALFSKSTVHSNPDLIFQENDVLLADANFFTFFDVPFIAGNEKDAFTSPNSIVINEEMAKKYFPNQNAINKTIKVNNKDYQITGITKQGSSRSHLNFNFLMKLDAFSFQPGEFENLNLAYLTYLSLNENVNRADLTDKISQSIRKYTLPVANAVGLDNYIIKAKLTPLEDIYQSHYLKSIADKVGGIKNGSPANIYIMVMVAFIILIIASFNYVNLNLAKGFLRTKEICVRKMSGAGKKQIRSLIVSEAFIMTGIGVIISLLLADSLLPLFNNITGKELNLSILLNPILLLALMTTIITIAFLSGIYPANKMAKTNPALLQSGNFFSGSNKSSFRQVFIVTQFIFSILLLISTFFISDQIEYMNTRELGFNKTDKLVINISNVENKEKFNILKQELKNLTGVNSVSLTSAIPGIFAGENPFKAKGQEKVNVFRMYFCDTDFIPTQGFKLIQGRNFSKDMGSDKKTAIINEKAVKLLNLENPLNSVIQDQTDKSNYQVIGVIKDFHHQSLQEDVKPVIIRMTTPRWHPEYLVVSLNDKQLASLIPAIEKIYKGIITDQPFECFFYDDLFQSLYQKDEKSLKVFTLASSLAIFLSCLGLFGLVIFILQRKTKEIGVRKVFGASTFGIVKHITKKFVYWILLANIIAWPLAYYYISSWLETYAFRISIDFNNFIIAGFLVLIISIITISAHVYKASLENPIKTLKHE